MHFHPSHFENTWSTKLKFFLPWDKAYVFWQKYVQVTNEEIQNLNTKLILKEILCQEEKWHHAYYKSKEIDLWIHEDFFAYCLMYTRFILQKPFLTIKVQYAKFMKKARITKPLLRYFGLLKCKTKLYEMQGIYNSTRQLVACSIF